MENPASGISSIQGREPSCGLWTTQVGAPVWAGPVASHSRSTDPQRALLFASSLCNKSMCDSIQFGTLKVDHGSAHAVDTYSLCCNALGLFEPLTALLNLERIESSFNILLDCRLPESVLRKLHVHSLESRLVGSGMNRDRKTFRSLFALYFACSIIPIESCLCINLDIQ